MVIIPQKKKNSRIDAPLITVITVVYNGAKTIEQTIKSVVNQTYQNVEYIIVDGESKDGTLDIVHKYEKYISYCISEPDKGIYDAMNKGIKLAQGDYISLLNSDDWLDPDAIEIVAKEIIKKRYDVYHGISRMLTVDDKPLDVYGATINALFKTSLSHQTCFISKEIYNNYLYDTKYKSAADYDFFCRLVKDNKSFKYIEKVMASYRMGGMSDSNIGLWETYRIKYKYGYTSFFSFITHELYYGIGLLLKNKRK